VGSTRWGIGSHSCTESNYFPTIPRMSETFAPPYITLSSLIPMAETSHVLTDLADRLIIWFPANNRNFSRSESLVQLFPAALSVSPITSEISQTRSFLALASVQISRSESAFALLNSVSDPTISARSNADPEVNSL
jgi:hypothetical protein